MVQNYKDFTNPRKVRCLWLQTCGMVCRAGDGGGWQAGYNMEGKLRVIHTEPAVNP